VRLTVKTHCVAYILTVRCAAPADDVTARQPTSLCATEDHYSCGLKRGGRGCGYYTIVLKVINIPKVNLNITWHVH